MAIAQTGSVLEIGPNDGANTGTASTTIEVPADAEFVVVGVSGYAGTTNYFTGGGLTFTKGGVDTAMTAASALGNASTSFMMAAMFYMALPDTGTNKTLKWDWAGTGTADERPIFSLTFWKGLNTSDPVRSTSGAQASATPFTSGTLTAVATDLILAWVGMYAASEGTIDSWSNLTLLAQVAKTNSSDGAWATGSPSGDTTVAASTDTNADDGGIVAIVIKAAAAGGAALDGDLQAQDAAIDAIANVIVAATAALQAQSSQIDAVVNVAVTVNGALAAQAAAITGAVSVIVAIDGDLEAQISNIDGLVEVLLAIDGDLEAQDAQIDGTILTGTPLSGALAAQSATVEGLATVGIALLAALQAQSAQTTGALAIALASDGSITSQNASVAGSISTELLRPPKNTFVRRAGWGRSARFWVERDR